MQPKFLSELFLFLQQVIYFFGARSHSGVYIDSCWMKKSDYNPIYFTSLKVFMDYRLRYIKTERDRGRQRETERDRERESLPNLIEFRLIHSLYSFQSSILVENFFSKLYFKSVFQKEIIFSCSVRSGCWYSPFYFYTSVIKKLHHIIIIITLWLTRLKVKFYLYFDIENVFFEFHHTNL